MICLMLNSTAVSKSFEIVNEFSGINKINANILVYILNSNFIR